MVLDLDEDHIRDNFKDELDTRYAELRDKGVFSELNFWKIVNQVGCQHFALPIWEKEWGKWNYDENTPYTSNAHAAHWSAKHIEMLDEWHSYC